MNTVSLPARPSRRSQSGLARNIRAALCALATLAVASCGSPSQIDVVSTVPTVATPTPTITTKDAQPFLRSYMEALAAHSDPARMRAGLKSTAPGSPAFTYLSHQANMNEASLDHGLLATDSVVELLADGSYQSCDVPTDQKSCVIYAAFKASAEGKLVDFTVDKQPLAPRLAAGNGKPVKFGTSQVTFLTAYKTIKNELHVTLKIVTDSSGAQLMSGRYRGSNGKQRDGMMLGSSDVGPKSNTILAVIIPGMSPGGKLTLTGLDSKFREFTAVFTIG